jgi:hypothetical protein
MHAEGALQRRSPHSALSLWGITVGMCPKPPKQQQEAPKQQEKQRQQQQPSKEEPVTLRELYGVVDAVQTVTGIVGRHMAPSGEDDAEWEVFAVDPQPGRSSDEQQAALRDLGNHLLEPEVHQAAQKVLRDSMPVFSSSEPGYKGAVAGAVGQLAITVSLPFVKVMITVPKGKKKTKQVEVMQAAGQRGGGQEAKQQVGVPYTPAVQRCAMLVGAVLSLLSARPDGDVLRLPQPQRSLAMKIMGAVSPSTETLNAQLAAAGRSNGLQGGEC